MYILRNEQITSQTNLFHNLLQLIILKNTQRRRDSKYDEKRTADDGNCLLRDVLGDVSATDHSDASSDATVV